MTDGTLLLQNAEATWQWQLANASESSEPVRINGAASWKEMEDFEELMTGGSGESMPSCSHQLIPGRGRSARANLRPTHRNVGRSGPSVYFYPLEAILRTKYSARAQVQ